MQGNVKAAKNRIQTQDFRNSKTSCVFMPCFLLHRKDREKMFLTTHTSDHTASSKSVFLS